MHHQNSLQLAERLIRANKQFDLRIYPNLAHGLGDAAALMNLYTMMTRFVKENL